MHLHFIQSNINWIWIKQEFCYINFSINDMKGMFLPRCRPLIWSSRESERVRFIFNAFSLDIWVWNLKTIWERDRNNNVILNITLIVRITLYNKATFVALIALLQLYFFSFKLSQKVFCYILRFCLHCVCTEKIRRSEYIFIVLLQLYIFFFSNIIM